MSLDNAVFQILKYCIFAFYFIQVTGTLINTGHSVLFKIDTNSSQPYDESRLAINITGGPLSYRYRFEEIHIHYGLHDQFGSEHSVQGYTFPAEVIKRSFDIHFVFYFQFSKNIISDK